MSQIGHPKRKIRSHFLSPCFVKFVTERSGYLVLGEKCFCFFRLLLRGSQELIKETKTASQRPDKENRVGPSL